MKCDKCEKELNDIWFPIGVKTHGLKEFLRGIQINTYCRECYRKILNNTDYIYGDLH